MKPTRALETSDSDAVEHPDARPQHRADRDLLAGDALRGHLSSGVSISVGSVAMSFVASYVRRSVISSASLRKWTVGVSLSRR